MKGVLTFRDASDADWPAIASLLSSAALPPDGARDHLANFLVGASIERLGCVGGYEHYGRVGLLRSMAVDEQWRGQGVGERLLDALKSRARAQHIDRLYLLTTTAAEYFGQRGFTTIERDTAPAVLRSSREFQGLCPASATLMVATLTTSGESA